MLAVLILLALALCHCIQCQEDEAKTKRPLMPVRPGGGLYNTVELIEQWKYKAEAHQVMTEDGYMLTVFRVAPARHTAPAVLLQHGFLGSSDCWVTDPHALAFKMSDAGLDVWIGNSRGNVYARNHTTLKPEDKQFWDFSWHEVGFKDLPAVVDYVQQTTNQSQLHYVGHSLGSTAGLVLVSTRPEYNQRLRSLVGLAPVAFLSKMSGIVGPGGFAEDIAASYMEQLKFSGKVEVFPRQDVSKNNSWQIDCDDLGDTLQAMCSGKVEEVQNFLGGAYLPAGQSLRTLDHLYQLAAYGVMKFYNMSAEENKKAYGSEEAPRYTDKFQQISVPVLLWSSEADPLILSKDVDDLVAVLPSVGADNRIQDECFGHLDFIIPETENCFSVRSKIYADIIESIKNIKNN